jgi:hypothetical protein
MLHLFVEGAQAYNQAGFLIGALACVGFGGFILGNVLYWRIHAVRAMGTVVGVIPNGGTYVPVYRYADENGDAHLAKSCTGSNSTLGKETGRQVALLIAAHNPDQAREANSHLVDIAGAVLVALGILLAYVALTVYPITLLTGIMAVGMLIYLGERGYRVFVRKGPAVSIADWRRLCQSGQAAINPADIKPIEALISGSDAQQIQVKRMQVAGKFVGVLWVVAAGLAGIGGYESVRIHHMESAGVRAEGEVVRLERGSGNSASYFPIVRVPLEGHSFFKFKDSVGSNPPGYRRGDKVTVLYFPEKLGDAMIDRGRWNWAMPAVLFAFAAVILAFQIHTWRSSATSGPQAATAT